MELNIVLNILVKIVNFGQNCAFWSKFGRVIDFWGELSIFGAIYRFLGRVIDFWGELSIFGASYRFLGRVIDF